MVIIANITNTLIITELGGVLTGIMREVVCDTRNELRGIQTSPGQRDFVKNGILR